MDLLALIYYYDTLLSDSTPLKIDPTNVKSENFRGPDPSLTS